MHLACIVALISLCVPLANGQASNNTVTPLQLPIGQPAADDNTTTKATLPPTPSATTKTPAPTAAATTKAATTPTVRPVAVTASTRPASANAGSGVSVNGLSEAKLLAWRTAVDNAFQRRLIDLKIPDFQESGPWGDFRVESSVMSDFYVNPALQKSAYSVEKYGFVWRVLGSRVISANWDCVVSLQNGTSWQIVNPRFGTSFRILATERFADGKLAKSGAILTFVGVNLIEVTINRSLGDMMTSLLQDKFIPAAKSAIIEQVEQVIPDQVAQETAFYLQVNGR